MVRNSLTVKRHGREAFKTVPTVFEGWQGCLATPFCSLSSEKISFWNHHDPPLGVTLIYMIMSFIRCMDGSVMVAMGYDCQAWMAYTMALRQANAIKHFEVVDQLEASMNRLATMIMADPRRVAAVQAGCASHFSDIQRRGGGAAAARQIADPAHDPALLETWMKSLPNDFLLEVEAAAKAEATSRKKAKSKKKP